MKTIGSLLKESRSKKKLSLGKLADATKIKKEFINSLEKEEWQVLPEYPVVQGFVKSIAQVLSLSQRRVVAVLRRDYPPKKLTINPKPDISNKFIWSPKLTFISGVLFVVLTVVGYLIFQYMDFINPPKLEISYPSENQVITSKEIQVSGSTDSDATVKINNQPALVEEDGSFKTNIEIFEGTFEVIVKATSRSGKETEVKRKIIPNIESTQD
ncbi:hypothetical protein A2Z22_02415 [Candidatus Woesebacteria bacterium RBG_16_34_12]|uniref:HTH cro/C1-type domain-containing protein n=1 Tax=Candidatus Woesebacteria bacterium RBG_16_34_12 TaxID=1802480 RepID=A0A1F7XB54_9BACT|nr:MAG: hypothetical protein A2Z22_02415 [Candidatus Woesebacteria bacterium RBG_16_34_12]